MIADIIWSLFQTPTNKIHMTNIVSNSWDATVEALKPIQEKYHRIIDDKYYLDSVLKEGKNRAETIANETLTKVKHSLGYLSSI